jgi:hypothetical protein
VWLFSANILVDEEVRAVSAAVSVASSSVIRSACALGKTWKQKLVQAIAKKTRVSKSRRRGYILYGQA